MGFIHLSLYQPLTDGRYSAYIREDFVLCTLSSISNTQLLSGSPVSELIEQPFFQSPESWILPLTLTGQLESKEFTSKLKLRQIQQINLSVLHQVRSCVPFDAQRSNR